MVAKLHSMNKTNKKLANVRVSLKQETATH